MRHANINDIVEVPTGYFITGSMANTVSSPIGGQGVLAVLLDHSLNVNADLSFESTNSEHTGVSAVYDASTDEVWLMSNNSVIHNPQITQIRDVSGGPFINVNYYLQLDPTYGGTNAAGFKLALSPYNGKTLVAAGLFRDHQDDQGNFNSSVPWIIEFERYKGSYAGGLIWPVPSPNFNAHGGGMFSTFSGEHPYFFNQEMMVTRPDKQGFTLVGPIKESGFFGIDVVTTLNVREAPPCFRDIKFKSNTIPYTLNPVVDMPQSVLQWAPAYDIPDFHMKNYVHCEEIYNYDGYAKADFSIHASPAIMSLSNEGRSSVSPNPVEDLAFIEIYGTDLTNHQFSIRNIFGQTMYHSDLLEGDYFTDRLPMDDLLSGAYFLVLTDNLTGKQNVTKFIKIFT